MFSNRVKYLLLFVFVCVLYAPTEAFNLKNIGESAVNIAKGVAEKFPATIPSAEDLFQLGKNAIAGYPFEKVNEESSLLQKVSNKK